MIEFSQTQKVCEKRPDREGNKRNKQTMTITTFHWLIVSYFTRINHTYQLFYNASICQVVNSKV